MSVEELPAVTEVGLSEAVGPAGETLAVRLTVPAVPLVTAVLVVEVPLPPCAVERLGGVGLIQKALGGGGAPQLGELKEAVGRLPLEGPFGGVYSFVDQKGP